MIKLFKKLTNAQHGLNSVACSRLLLKILATIHSRDLKGNSTHIRRIKELKIIIKTNNHTTKLK
jgi:hypothetical protein